MTNERVLKMHRAAGVLLGTAAGDALGAGYEFTHPRPDQPIDMIGGGLGPFAPGEWTDDTSMAVAVAEVTATGVDVRTAAGLDAVAANFVRWYDSRPKDIGVQTSTVLRRRDATGAAMTATAASLTGRKGGNGSLMRTAQIGLAFPGDPAATAEAALAVSRLTHDDERAGEACQLWSLLIEHAVRTGEIDTDWTVLGFLDPSAAEFWLPLKHIAETGSPVDFANNGWVVHALQTAWWAITTTNAGQGRQDPHHLQRALEQCVRAGHDTDTTAAIAGGLLGARYGVSAIPARWRRILHGWPGLRADDLIRLAVQTYTGSASDRRWPGLGRMGYPGLATGHATTHPHDDGVIVGGYGALATADHDAVISLCRIGRDELAGDHVTVWLLDTTADENPNLEFVLADTAELVRQLRSEGKRVLLHCVEGRSRTPSVAARYSLLLSRDPAEVRTAMPWADPQRWLWDAATHPRG